MTQYLIFRKHPSTELDLWEDTGDRVQAGSAERALAIYKDSDARVQAGQHVAVSARSWKPRPFSVDQRTVITIG